MIEQFINGIGSIGIVVLVVIGYVALHIQGRKQARREQESPQFYVFKISRVTGHSEYDVFCKSAEEWPVAKVSKEKIDADFKDYLGRDEIPPYVNHFVQQNKQHIDELRMPPF